MRAVAIANRHPRLRLSSRAVARMIEVLDEQHAGLATRESVLSNGGELSIVFLTDSALARLHAQFLNDPSVTDVITFTGDPSLGVAGEICVSVDAAVRQSSAGRRSSAEFSREIALYVVHGWLHLAGYDDLQPARKREMRRAEQRALSLLDRAAAVPRFGLRK